MEILALFLGVMVLLFILGVPVAIAIGVTCLIGLLVQNDFTSLPATLFPLKMMHGINNFSTLAIPFFLFAANVMCKGTLTSRIFNFANALVGHIRGGLGHVNVLGSMIFAGMSGLAVADAAGLGTLEIRAMREQGYPLSYSVGITGASSIIGPIIPPSVGMVIYGWLGDVSVGRLFMGGLIPGILLGGSLMVVTWIMSYWLPMPLRPRPPLREILKETKKAILSLMMPVIIVGGIWTGAFTPTESGAAASAYAIILGLFVYRDLSWRDLLVVCKETIEYTVIVLFIMGFAVLYGWLLVRLQIPHILAEKIMLITTNKTLLLFLVMIFMMIIGCFMSAIDAIVIFTPIMVPTIQVLGIDPVFFGVFMVISMTVGVITPPFGTVLFVLSAVTKMRFDEVVKAHVPFLIPILIVIIMLALFPGLVTFLPNLLL